MEISIQNQYTNLEGKKKKCLQTNPKSPGPMILSLIRPLSSLQESILSQLKNLPTISSFYNGFYSYIQVALKPLVVSSSFTA